MSEKIRQIEKSREKVNSEIHRLNKIQENLEELLQYCRKMDNLGTITIDKTNIPHPNKNHGRIKFDITAHASNLNETFEELAKKSYLDNTKIVWMENENLWQLTTTFKDKI